MRPVWEPLWGIAARPATHAGVVSAAFAEALNAGRSAMNSAFGPLLRSSYHADDGVSSAFKMAAAKSLTTA